MAEASCFGLRRPEWVAVFVTASETSPECLKSMLHAVK